MVGPTFRERAGPSKAFGLRRKPKVSKKTGRASASANKLTLIFRFVNRNGQAIGNVVENMSNDVILVTGSETAPVDFLVVGAGLAGLAFAQDVQAQGATVRLLDKARGLGGRAATRRLEGARADHGAQFFTARNDRFREIAERGVRDGWNAVWSNGFPLFKNGAIQERPSGHPRYAPLPGMNELPKRLGVGLNVTTGATVVQIERSENGVYTARTDNGLSFAGRSLILNLPPVQLLALGAPLLQESDRSSVSDVRLDPAWTLILRLDSDLPGANWPALEYENHPVLYWVSRDHTKREPGSPPVVVVHGSGAWSTVHLEDAKEDVQAALLAALNETVGPVPAVREAQTHRWRYSQPTRPLGRPCLWDKERRIGACGDWCDGARVEGAVQSGWALAGTVLAS